VNSANSEGFTPLHVACFNNQRECAELLLDKVQKKKERFEKEREDMMTREYMREETKERSASHTSPSLPLLSFALFLSQCADISAINANGNTPLQEAEQADASDCVQFLRSLSADQWKKLPDTLVLQICAYLPFNHLLSRKIHL
jgi:ankyrin repeat protein